VKPLPPKWLTTHHSVCSSNDCRLGSSCGLSQAWQLQSATSLIYFDSSSKRFFCCVSRLDVHLTGFLTSCPCSVFRMHYYRTSLCFRFLMHSEFKLTNWTIPTFDHGFNVTLNSDTVPRRKKKSQTTVDQNWRHENFLQ